MGSKRLLYSKRKLDVSVWRATRPQIRVRCRGCALTITVLLSHGDRTRRLLAAAPASSCASHLGSHQSTAGWASLGRRGLRSSCDPRDLLGRESRSDGVNVDHICSPGRRAITITLRYFGIREESCSTNRWKSWSVQVSVGGAKTPDLTPTTLVSQDEAGISECYTLKGCRK